jgi:hypothetical protein
MALHGTLCEDGVAPDPSIDTEQGVQNTLTELIPTPGRQSEEGGRIIRRLLAEFLRKFSLRTLLFLLDMVLPQLDAYNAGRHMQQLCPWVSLCLEQHAQLLPLLLFCDSTQTPVTTPWNLCERGNLGSMEANVMAGRALLALFGVESKGLRCAVFILMDKRMQGSSKTTAAARAYRRISPKELELVLLPYAVASAFCDRLLAGHLLTASYFDPAVGWPQPFVMHDTLAISLQQLALLGDTKSRRELSVFAEANPARLPLAMCILQTGISGIPVRRMARERKAQLTEALVKILRRFLTPAEYPLVIPHDQYFRQVLLAPASHGDGHVLAVTVALLLAVVTGRSDLWVAGVFGAGKTRSLAVLLIALSCVLEDFYAVIFTKENVAAKALSDQICDFQPPSSALFGRLLGRIEEGKGEAYTLAMVPPPGRGAEAPFSRFSQLASTIGRCPFDHDDGWIKHI